jgi:peptidoglycan/LPS O-acetylase OafA/YrhL
MDKKLLMWGVLIAFVAASIGWLSSDTDHTPAWPALGFLAGVVMELGYFLAERCGKTRISAGILFGLGVVLAIVVVFNHLFPGLDGFAAGMLFPVVSTLLICRIRRGIASEGSISRSSDDQSSC